VPNEACGGTGASFGLSVTFAGPKGASLFESKERFFDETLFA
jgi:hypothetical protein